MNRDIGRFLAPAFAVALFVFVILQTLNALQDSGVWRFGTPRVVAPPADPLASLDGLISRARGATFAGASRDPFGYGAAASRPGPDRPAPRRPDVPSPPTLPVLTAIIYDNDPRAIVRWEGREFTVHSGSLFAEFEVMSIVRDQVVLKRGSESIVLRRKPQGD